MNQKKVMKTILTQNEIIHDDFIEHSQALLEILMSQYNDAKKWANHIQICNSPPQENIDPDSIVELDLFKHQGLVRKCNLRHVGLQMSNNED